MITKRGGTTCNSQLFRDSVPSPGLFLFLPCETCAYAVSNFWPQHDVLHHSYLYVFPVLSLPFSCYHTLRSHFLGHSSQNTTREAEAARGSSMFQGGYI